MTNHEPKLTIFISSMIGPLWDERAAVEGAIKTGIPLARTWVFERAPASSEAITESYLARVRECDIYLLILGQGISVKAGLTGLTQFWDHLNSGTCRSTLWGNP